MHILLNFVYLWHGHYNTSIHVNKYVLLDYGLGSRLGHKLISKFFTNL
jgi:hypothetical protein